LDKELIEHLEKLDLVFVVKVYGADGKVKEETVTSKLETAKASIKTYSSDHVGLSIYFDGERVKSLNYQAELSVEDTFYLMDHWLETIDKPEEE
jgi:hypothetical protein